MWQVRSRLENVYGADGSKRIEALRAARDSERKAKNDAEQKLL